MVVCRLLRPGSKLRVERELGPSGQTTLAALLDLHDTPVDDLYDTLDWLADRQPWIERKLAKRHLEEDSLALYDVSSSYFEGSRCPLAQRGYSRDHRADRPQIVYGLLCNPEGCPVAVQCFAGNTGDPDTLASQVARLRDRFGLQRVALVGDRGMIAHTRIKADLEPVGFDWITALRNKTIRKLADANVIQPGLFDSYGFASVTAPDFPGERLLVCYNPLVAAERRRKMGKHFRWTFDAETEAFRAERKAESIAAEARLDGLYVIRTSLTKEDLGDPEVIAAYKSLARVERAFRSLKTTVLQVRPIFHWKEKRVRAHVFLCMLAYYLEWHLRRRWAPLLFAEEDGPEWPQGPVGQPVRGAAAESKERKRQTPGEGLPVQSFTDLLGSLGAMAAVELEYEQVPDYTVPTLSELTPLQQRAFKLLKAEPHPAPALSAAPEARAGT